MVKKKIKKAKNKKEGGKESEKTKIKNKEIALLLENFAIMQKTLADITIAFKQLEKRFEKFLNLVEKAAKEKVDEEKIAEGKSSEEIKKEKSLAEKIDTLIEQNKAIAEGMLLLEKFIKEKLEEIGKI